MDTPLCYIIVYVANAKGSVVLAKVASCHNISLHHLVAILTGLTGGCDFAATHPRRTGDILARRPAGLTLSRELPAKVLAA